MKTNSIAPADRRLRGLVADLANRGAEDIEAVWHALSASERAQLRPLLVDAAALRPVAPDTFESMLLPAPASAEVRQDPGLRDAVDAPMLPIGRLAGHWPDALLARLAGCLDEAQRERCLAVHPQWRLRAAAPLAPRAREALLKAARDAVEALPDNLRDGPAPAASATKTPAPAPRSWARRLLVSLRGGRA
ncbi:hypothetical protein [Burkholderia plantarii]|uniref:Uncharacterized protein n=1 Tax=Burkholderia plantarii TaxID=41899 RepID=A0A0B6S112_BURPL|nr:hypothetical protein [Burkholderia plantarii]AJK45901.1 hypothetical protein BGL_1c13850 [Burkholderia plantarii]